MRRVPRRRSAGARVDPGATQWECGTDLGEISVVNENVLRQTHPFPGMAGVRWSARLGATGLALLLAGCATSGGPVPDEQSARAAFAEAVQRGDWIGADEAVATFEQHFAGEAVATRKRLQNAVAVDDQRGAPPDPEPQRIDTPDAVAAIPEADRPRPSDTAAAGSPAAAEPRAAPESQRHTGPAVGASGGMEWIRTQPRNAFTIQVLGLERERGVRDFLARQSLERETAMFRTERNGSDWFVAIAGSHPNAEAARGAMASLPAEVRQNQPWIRSFGSVQDAIRGE